MRYAICVQLDDGRVAELDDSSLDRAIVFAKRLAEGGWFEVIDTMTSNIVASSETEAGE